MSEATVRGILQQIDRLSDEERLNLSAQLAERTESDWQEEAGTARRVAQDKGITQSTVDQAIEQMRYGK